MIQQTSLDAFSEVKDSLGERQLQVLNFFRTHRDLDFSNNELSWNLQLPINRVTPRVYELRSKGYLCHSLVRYCRITGKKVIAWKLIE